MVWCVPEIFFRVDAGSPIKQGLKQNCQAENRKKFKVDAGSPIKQGLKQIVRNWYCKRCMVDAGSPIKQGLKPIVSDCENSTKES